MPPLPALQWRRLERHMLIRQDLRPKTVECTLRSLRALERHGLNLSKPRRLVYDKILLKLKRGGARNTALVHYHRAVVRLLNWQGIEWAKFEPPHVERADVQVLPDHVVAQLLDHEDPVARFCFRLGFYTAIRPPSEHVALRVQDFNTDTGELWVWSDKVDRGRTLQLEPWLAEIVREYLQDQRPDLVGGRRVEALLVTPKGKRWTPENYRMWIARRGRDVAPWFKPYAMRHWGATYRAIQTGFDVLVLQDWLGHRQISTTRKYIHVAELMLRKRMLEHQVPPLQVAAAPA